MFTCHFQKQFVIFLNEIVLNTKVMYKFKIMKNKSQYQNKTSASKLCFPQKILLGNFHEKTCNNNGLSLMPY